MADNLKETKRDKRIKNAGFTIKIPEILQLAQEHESLQLVLQAGNEKEVIWEASAQEIKKF